MVISSKFNFRYLNFKFFLLEYLKHDYFDIWSEMKKDQQTSIVTINPYSNVKYVCDENIIKKFTSRFTKKNFYISFLSTKDFIVTQIDISKNIPEEDLQDVLELKAYEELDLDQTIEYKIDYFEKPSLASDKERHFLVFVTEPKIIDETFKNIRSTIPYIDYILPAPLLLKTLYTHEILENSNTDLFIYIQKNDAFLALYQLGTLIYSKSLKYSFEDIAERLSELTEQNISAHDVMKDLEREGLKISDLDKLQYYMQIFSELFMHINDVLIYAKRSNNIDIIDHIYFSSEIGFIKGIEEYCQTYLTQEAYDFAFDYDCESQEPFVEDLHYLMALSAKDILYKDIAYPNFTIFPKPAPFFKRPSGELTLLIIGAIVAGSIYPLYNYFLGFKYKYEALVMHEKYPKIHSERVRLETRINQLKKELTDVKKKVALKKQEFQKSQEILNQIYNKKVNYIMKGVTIADLSQDLVKHKLLLNNLENNETKFDLNVTATDDKQITKFIKYISDNKYERYDIETKEINKTSPQSGIYNSIIEVKIR